MLDLNFTPFPEISTNRLFLRQIRAVDAQDFFLLRSNEEVMLYLDRPKAESKAQMQDFIKELDAELIKSTCIQWAICMKNENRLIGSICYWRIIKEHHRAEMGYMLMPQFHRKGLMQEAIKGVIDYGFGPMGLHSIEAQVSPENMASIKVLERNSFLREGYYKENYFWNNQFIDTAVYSLLKSNWQTNNHVK